MACATCQRSGRIKFGFENIAVLKSADFHPEAYLPRFADAGNQIGHADAPVGYRQTVNVVSTTAGADGRTGLSIVNRNG